MRTFINRALAALSFATIASCGAMGPGGQMGPYQPPPGDNANRPGVQPSTASCDPKGCADFCWYAGCLFSDNADATVCKAACASRCGDGMFDDQDTKVMACVQAAGMQIDCSGAKTCCADNFTSQLCSEQ